MSHQRNSCRRHRHTLVSFLLLLLTLLCARRCRARTSSTALKHAVKGARSVGVRVAAAGPGARQGTSLLLRQSGGSATKSAVLQQTTKKLGLSIGTQSSKLSAASATTSSSQVALVQSGFARTPSHQITRRTFVPTKTGFRQFSQRATRLQTQLRKSFSLRAIFSDVITNHPGSSNSKPSSSSSQGTATSMAAASEQQQQQQVLQQQEQHAAAAGLDAPSVIGPRSIYKDMQRIATGTLLDSWSGFTGGYALRAGMDVTRRLSSQVLELVGASGTSAAATTATAASMTGHVLPYPSLMRFSQQCLQMHSKSLQFGLEWAQMSAVFGACRLLVQTVRQNRNPYDHDNNDEWNSVGGSCLAGAVFSALPAKGLPVVAMTRGALLYGGTMFLLHPNLWKQGMEKLQLTPLPSSTDNAVNEQWWDGMQ